MTFTLRNASTSITIAACLLTLSSCCRNMATFPTLSTSSFDATAIPINADKLTKPTEGSSWNFYVLFLDSNNNMLQDAIKDTLEKGKGDVIINAKVCMSRIRVVYFGAESIKVEGTVINTKALAKAKAKAKAKK